MRNSCWWLAGAVGVSGRYSWYQILRPQGTHGVVNSKLARHVTGVNTGAPSPRARAPEYNLRNAEDEIPNLHPKVERLVGDPSPLLAVGQKPLVVATAQPANVGGGVAPEGVQV